MEADGRRRFNASERMALYFVAGGSCEECGTDLATMHADHVYPASRGGPTDVVNGRALCPPCNLKKGNKVIGLRPWQQEALNQYARHTSPDFLAVATPGSGKTRFALAAMKQDPASDFYVVVVPSTPLRRQWAEAAALCGIDLDPAFENGNMRPPTNVDGVVVTYSSVASMPHLYRTWGGRRQVFVVLDEIHHCGDEYAWGDAIRQAFEPAQHRLLLSGTPFRKDNNPIPFVTYEGDPPTSRPDYRYDYGTALAEGVVRAIEFSFYDGTARWMDAGELISVGLTLSKRDDEGRALKSALMPDSEWLQVVLPQAHQTLQRIRRDVPDAGGLVIAKDQNHARALAQRLRSVTGQPVPIAISEDPAARDVIEDFITSQAPWLVAVNMVSEGVDIPRLMVGVYATLSRTNLFFRQAVGRFVRVRGDESDSHAATVFVPSIPRLLKLARDLEIERDHVLNVDLLEREPKDPSDGPVMQIEPLAAVDGRYHSSIINGDEVDDAEYRRACALVEQQGVNWNPAQVALLLRAAETTPVTPVEPAPTERAPYRERETLRAEVNRLVNRYAYESDERHGDVWMRLNKAVGEKAITEASVASLTKRIALLSKWLKA